MKTDDVPREKTTVGGDVGCGGWHRMSTRRADCTKADTWVGRRTRGEWGHGLSWDSTFPLKQEKWSSPERESAGGAGLKRQKVGNHCSSHRCFKGFATSGDQPPLHFKTETNTPKGHPSTSSINHLQCRLRRTRKRTARRRVKIKSLRWKPALHLASQTSRRNKLLGRNRGMMSNFYVWSDTFHLMAQRFTSWKWMRFSFSFYLGQILILALILSKTGIRCLPEHSVCTISGCPEVWKGLGSYRAVEGLSQAA